ncbi:MAG: methyl-accepting chemotaxis protein, partial [Comamonas sp.]
MHTTPNTLTEWLAHCEQIHPQSIAMGLERVQEVARRMALRFDCPVITVAGTNGKGSTCAMLEAVALQSGYKPGVYTSPHLVHFEERCRIHGEIAKADDFLPHFAAVEAARAGVQGRGFAVVAAEVRELAQRSADAARQIRQLMDHSTQQMKSGQTLALQAGQRMEHIVRDVQKVSGLIASITEAAQAQNQG